MAEDLGKEILDTAHEIKHGMNRYVGMPELSGFQVRILGYISRANRDGRDIFRKDLELALNIRRPSVTSVLNTMEKNGYIRREPLERDVRLKRIVLTDKALDVEKNFFGRIEEFSDMLVRGLSSKQIDDLFQSLERIRKNIKNSEGEKR